MRTLTSLALGLALAAAFGAKGCTNLANLVPQGKASERQAVLERHVDGDTVEVRYASGRTDTVRILGIDTPETVRPGTPTECGGPEASAAMARFEGQRVTVRTDPSQDERDRYGRLLGYVTTVGGTDVGESQVKDGNAEVYIYEGHPFERADRYERDADRAKAAGLGVWGNCDGNFHSSR